MLRLVFIALKLVIGSEIISEVNITDMNGMSMELRLVFSGHSLEKCRTGVRFQFRNYLAT